MPAIMWLIVGALKWVLNVLSDLYEEVIDAKSGK